MAAEPEQDGRMPSVKRMLDEAFCEPDVAALQHLWASAYDSWIQPPGAKLDEVVYLSPSTVTGFTENSQSPWMEAVLLLADQHGGIFGLTAFNPMGRDEPHSINLKRNALMEADLKKLCAETGGIWWPSFGFSRDWHEKGFSVAAPEDRVIELARKYRQGAIYRFRRPTSDFKDDTEIVRSTIPVGVPDTEADVPVRQCKRPSLEQADPSWAPAD